MKNSLEKFKRKSMIIWTIDSKNSTVKKGVKNEKVRY